MIVRAVTAVALAIASGLAVAGAPPSLTVTHEARALQPGELVAVTIVSDAPLTSVSVTAFGRTERVQALPPTPDRPHAWITLVGIDLDVKPGNYRVRVTAENGTEKASASHTLAVVAKTFPTRRLTVNPDFVSPPASVTDRIVREARTLTDLWKGAAGPDPAPLVFMTPVADKANSAFGSRSVFNGEPRSPHGGADFQSPAGTPIHAPAPGKVVLAGDLYYTGGTVVIDHGLGVVSLFAHMSKIIASEGADVAQGDVLGLVGATGRVTGPHLHWTVRVNGARVDPLSLVAVLTGSRLP